MKDLPMPAIVGRDFLIKNGFHYNKKGETIWNKENLGKADIPNKFLFTNPVRTSHKAPLTTTVLRNTKIPARTMAKVEVQTRKKTRWYHQGYFLPEMRQNGKLFAFPGLVDFKKSRGYKWATATILVMNPTSKTVMLKPEVPLGTTHLLTDDDLENTDFLDMGG